MPAGHTTKQTLTRYRADLLRSLPLDNRRIRNPKRFQLGCCIGFGWATMDPKNGYVVTIKLSGAAFDRSGRLLLRPQDLPDPVRELASKPMGHLVEMKHEAALCDSPYLTCAWTGAKA